MSGTSGSPTTLVWFRRDLRLGDHPALVTAAARGAVVPVFIWAPDEDGAWPPGGASRWWSHHALASLQQSLEARGSRLILRRGPSLPALLALAKETGARRVHFSPLLEPAAAARDERVAEGLRARGLEVERHGSALLFEPGTIRSAAGTPFAVFTAFWRACLAAPPPAAPLPAPARLVAPARWPTSVALEALELDPRHPWTAGLARTWQPGEKQALVRLRALVRHRLARYEVDRDLPALDGTSTLSPYLHHGEVGPRQIWQALRDGGAGAPAFRRELGWREFAHHVLARLPSLPEVPCRPEFLRFAWQHDPGLLRAWQQGRTGYPLVDAGMRQLWTTGWMHNRVRMVVASFLVKHLLLPWQEGERWFWDTLVDADLANNALNWQWVAGTGVDPAPYFRIFNPVIQSRKFDPGGRYIRAWVPELAGLSDREIHEPWKVAAKYPEPVVEHRFARARALALFAELRAQR
jgi:deoxyribodipyrimidine photo-lyase